MNLKTELNKLTENDIYSLMLFVLYKSNEVDECSALSRLSYILDKKNLLNLCEFFGGQTIRIPTIHEFEVVLSALLMFQKIDVEGMDAKEYLSELKRKDNHWLEINKLYVKVKEVLARYNFNSGR